MHDVLNSFMCYQKNFTKTLICVNHLKSTLRCVHLKFPILNLARGGGGGGGGLGGFKAKRVHHNLSEVYVTFYILIFGKR